MSARRRRQAKGRSWLWVLGVALFVGGGVAFQMLAALGGDPLAPITKGRLGRQEREFVQDPIDRAALPVLADSDRGRAAASAETPRQVAGRLTFRDGAPARDLEYWLAIASLPAAELRGEMGEGSLLRPPAEPLGRTDAEGRWNGFVRGGGSAVLVVRVHASLLLALAVSETQEAQAQLALPELAQLTIECEGLAPASTLRVRVTPAFARAGLLKKTFGGATDIVVPLGAQATAALVSAEQELTWDSKPLRLAWLPGAAAEVAVDGVGFDLAPGSATLEAPARYQGKLDRSFPVVTLRLDEPRRAGGPAFVLLSRRPDPNEVRRRVPLGTRPVRFDLRADLETTYVIDVVDSELRHERLELKEADVPKDGVLPLAQASATAPLVLSVPPRPGLERARLWCEKADKIMVELDPLEQYLFAVDQFGCWTQREPGRFLLADPPKGWRQLFVVLPDGEVARVAGEPRKPIEAQWLPSRALPDLDLVKLAKEHFGARAGMILFDIDLKSIEGVPEEVVAVDRVEAPGDLKSVPVWRKRAPLGFPARLVFHVPSEVLDRVELDK